MEGRNPSETPPDGSGRLLLMAYSNTKNSSAFGYVLLKITILSK